MEQRTNWVLLGNALLGTFLTGVGARIYYIAMPTVARSLHTDVVGISWSIMTYLLANAGFSLLFGRIGDIWGRRRIYGIAYLVTLVGSLLCGLSTNVYQLMGFRFLQGIGASMTGSVGRAVAGRGGGPGNPGKSPGLYDHRSPLRISLRAKHWRSLDRLSGLEVDLFFAGPLRGPRRSPFLYEVRTPRGRYHAAACRGLCRGIAPFC